MKVKKMFISNFVNQYVVKKTDGTYARFFITPFRKLSEADLIPVPFYPEKGENAEEVSWYIYKLYGLCKE